MPSLTFSGLTSALLLVSLSMGALARPSFRHHHLHHSHENSATTFGSGVQSVDSQEPADNGSALDLVRRNSEPGSMPAIFEHKHQREYRAAPGQPVVREVYQPIGTPDKRDIVYVTEYFYHTVFLNAPNVPVPASTPLSPEVNYSQLPISWVHPTSDASEPSTAVDPPVYTTPAPGSMMTSVAAVLPVSSDAPLPTSLVQTTMQPKASTYVATLPEHSSAPASSVLPSVPAKVAPSSSLPGIMQSISYAASGSTPSVSSTTLLGKSSQEPVMEYVDHTNQKLSTLASNLLNKLISSVLTTGYGIYNGSGTLTVSDSATTSPLKYKPYMSRDNGKGGYLNGHKIFMFADTGIANPADDYAFGGFVSSSVAVDKGMAAAYGKPVVLQDMMGEWDNESGLMRGFIPFTEGEAAYTSAMQGHGARYAIWPESSLIPLDSENALVYAAIVYIDTGAANLFQGCGNTLLQISIPGKGGPKADRIVKKMYEDDEVTFGGIGGIRSWGASGPGGHDGKVYVFANKEGGLLLGRTNPGEVADKSSYEYYSKDSNSWSSTGPSASRPSGFFTDGAYSNMDMFYSPRHLTFIMVFQTPYADNTFYWRYLKADKEIRPSYAGGSDEDIVENIYKYDWSASQILYKAPKSPAGKYIYAGGMHMGYFDEDDIVNGGNKMLLQWTAPLAEGDKDGYDFDTAVVTFH